MIPTIRSMVRPAWVALLLCVSLAACGGDDNGPGGSDAAAPTTSELKPVRPDEPAADKPGLRCAP